MTMNMKATVVLVCGMMAMNTFATTEPKVEATATSVVTKEVSAPVVSSTPATKAPEAPVAPKAPEVSATKAPEVKASAVSAKSTTTWKQTIVEGPSKAVKTVTNYFWREATGVQKAYRIATVLGAAGLTYFAWTKFNAESDEDAAA